MSSHFIGYQTGDYIRYTSMFNVRDWHFNNNLPASGDTEKNTG